MELWNGFYIFNTPIFLMMVMLKKFNTFKWLPDTIIQFKIILT